MLAAPFRISYGPSPDQFAELHRPDPADYAEPLGTVVVLHGGFWRAQYDLSLGTPLARNLAEHGYLAWNLEYRRVGQGGGWPYTFLDVAAGIDHLARLDADLGIAASRILAVGHSAGGHLAVWAAGRDRLQPADPGALPQLRISGVVAQAGVLDLATAARTGVGQTAVTDLLGADLDSEPDRWRAADPLGLVPLAVPVVCLHSRHDQDVPMAQSTAYVAAATRAGGQARLLETQGDHYSLIDPRSNDWQVGLAQLAQLLGN